MGFLKPHEPTRLPSRDGPLRREQWWGQVLGLALEFMSMRQSSLKVLLFALCRLLVDRVLTLLVVRGVESAPPASGPEPVPPQGYGDAALRGAEPPVYQSIPPPGKWPAGVLQTQWSAVADAVRDCDGEATAP
jgi:hypothetical protein